LKTAAARLGASMQDLSGDSIAAILAVGLVLGTFPVYGGPTVLCLLAAVVFRLNAPALQLANQLSSPLQLALLVPFSRMGERILGASAVAPAGAPVMASHGIVARFGEFTMQAIAGWCCIALPLGALIFIAVSRSLRRCPLAVAAS
jgi:uncharacterized protein (DUF2062 family)